MKKIASVAISIVLLAVSFGLVSCGEMKDTQVYGADIDKTYFTASYVVSQPSVSEKDFAFPVVTKSPIKKLTDLKFFTGKRDLGIEIESLLIKPKEAFAPENLALPIKTNDYRYVIEAKLNIFEITDPIKIDSITMKINGYEKRFQVDITITYRYIDYETHPNVFVVAPSEILDWETVPGGRMKIVSTIQVRRQTVMHGLQYRSIPVSPQNVLFQKGNEAPVPFVDGAVMETNTLYSLTIFLENPKLDQFYDEGLNVTVTAEGLHEMTLYGNLDLLDTGLFNLILSSSQFTFFS